MEWKVGQKVYCLQFGEGAIIDIDNTELYSIKVDFLNVKVTYTSEGKMRSDDVTPMLYPAKPEIVLPKWQPKPGEWCWFWDQGYKGAYVAKFDSISLNQLYIDHEDAEWQNCAPFNGELPEHLKEVQP